MKADQTRRSGSEPASVAVKSLKLRLVVNVEPDASPGTRTLGRGFDYGLAETGSLVVWVDHSVEQETVDAAVPHDMDECHELVLQECTYPGQAVF
jgi:hypothetical protein